MDLLRSEAGATRPSYTGPMAPRNAGWKEPDRCSRGASPRCVRPEAGFAQRWALVRRKPEWLRGNGFIAVRPGRRAPATPDRWLRGLRWIDVAGASRPGAWGGSRLRAATGDGKEETGMAAREWNYRGEAGATRPSYTGPLGFAECGGSM